MKALVRFFRNSLPITFAAILIVCIAFWVVEFYMFGRNSVVSDFGQQSLVFPSIAHYFDGLPLVMWGAGAAFFIVFSFVVLTLNTRFIFIQERTFMPVLFLGFIIGFPNIGLIPTPVALFSLFFVIALHRVFNSYRADYALSNFFEASFIVGFGSFFWLPGLIFILVILAGLAIFRQFNWREWVSSIVGFLTPLFFFELYQFFVNNQAWVLVGDIANAFLTASPYNLILTRLNLVFIFYVAFLVLLGSIKVMQNYDSFKIRSRKIFIVFFWTFVCALLGFLFLEGISYEVIFLGAIPVSFLLTYLFSVDRNPTRFQSILFILFIVLAFMQVVF